MWQQESSTSHTQGHQQTARHQGWSSQDYYQKRWLLRLAAPNPSAVCPKAVVGVVAVDSQTFPEHHGACPKIAFADRYPKVRHLPKLPTLKLVFVVFVP